MGGYSFLFFSVMDAIGHSRYLPVVIYAKGRPDRAAYVGHGMETFDNAVRAFWTPAFYPTASSTTDAAVLAVEHLAKIGAGRRPDRDRAGVPARGRAGGAGGAAGGRAVRRCHRRAGAAAGGEDAGGARQAAAGVGAHHRRDAGDDRLGARGDDQGRDHRAAAARGGRAGAAFRLLPADARGEPQPGAVGAGLGGGRGHVDRLRAAISTGISAISRAWACWASRMRSWRTCWPRSRLCSRRPSRRCGPGAPGGEVGARALEVMAAGPSGGFSEFFVHGMGLISHEAAVPDAEPDV